MAWRVKTFFADSQLEEYLNAVVCTPDQVSDLHPVVQGPRTGVRLVCWLREEQIDADTSWSASAVSGRGVRGVLPTPSA